MTGKQTVPRVFRDDTNRNAILGIGAGETILHVNILALQMGLNLLAQSVEIRLLERAVYLAPPDVFFRRSFTHQELIVCRAAGVLPRVDDQRPEVRDTSFVAPHGVFVQLSGA